MENRQFNIDPKDYSSVYDYLESLGIIEFGTHQEIQEAKSFYWKCYRNHYKKEKFESKNKSVSISFKLDEYHHLKKNAESLKLPISRYLKEQLSQKGKADNTELELLVLDLIVELEDENLTQERIISRLDVLLEKLKE